ncbi:hypothetical protein ACLB2K_050843 [Fragaria x ananassa]
MKKAREFLEQIQGKGFVPESENFHFANNHLEKAMKGIKIDEDIKKTCDKKVREVTMQMLRSLIHNGNRDEANEIYKFFSETGVYLKVTGYTTIIQSYLMLGKNKGALETYWDMFVRTGVSN